MVLIMWLLLAVVLIFAAVGYDTMAGNMILFHKLGGIDVASLANRDMAQSCEQSISLGDSCTWPLGYTLAH